MPPLITFASGPTLQMNQKWLKLGLPCAIQQCKDLLMLWKKTADLLREFPGTPRNGTPFWEASHTIPINNWKFMGSLWEPYGKGVPFFGAPGNSLEISGRVVFLQASFLLRELPQKFSYHLQK